MQKSVVAGSHGIGVAVGVSVGNGVAVLVGTMVTVGGTDVDLSMVIGSAQEPSSASSRREKDNTRLAGIFCNNHLRSSEICAIIVGFFVKGLTHRASAWIAAHPLQV